MNDFTTSTSGGNNLVKREWKAMMSEDVASVDDGVKTVLILIHGMVTERFPADHHLGYAELLDNLALYGIRRSEFDAIAAVEWGHEPWASPVMPFASLREDERLTRAEVHLNERVSAKAVRDSHSVGNRQLGPTGSDLISSATRLVTQRIKDEVMLYGITDALYYASPDGETAIRSTVYHQVLSKMESVKDAQEVRLFVMAHSLGVTIAHDFLYGLFAEYHDPDFAAPESDPEANKPSQLQASANYTDDKAQYLFWNHAAKRKAGESGPRLTLGAFITAGGQLPLMLVRKQRLVDQFAQSEALDPTVIGVPREGEPVWYNFYDTDDVLGYPCRLLYGDVPTIVEFQVNTGILQQAHVGYWKHDLVAQRSAELLRAYLPARPEEEIP